MGNNDNSDGCLTDFSFELADANGAPLFVGDQVKLLSVDSCAHDLPQEDQDRLFSFVGDIRTILEVDEFNCIWLSFYEAEKDRGADFCLIPSEVLLAQPARKHMEMSWPEFFGKKQPLRETE